MYRILLVDDEILVRDAIKENIDWKGRTVNWSEVVKRQRGSRICKRTSGGYCVDRYIDAIHGRNGTEQFSA